MVLLIARLVVAAVFAVAAVTKLRDLDGSRRAVAEFGVPGRAAILIGTLLPAAELAVAGALLVDPIAAGGALAALVLLLTFTVAIASSLVRGKAPDCNCFGQLHSSPASGRTMARNLGLAALAAFVAIGLGEVAATFAIAAAGGLALLPTVPGLLRRATRGEREDAGLALGALAPGFSLPTVDGVRVSLDSLRRRGLPVLLVFTDPGCGPCVALAPRVARWQRELERTLTIAVLESKRNGAASGDDEHGRRDVLFQANGEIAGSYGARGTPSAVLVGIDGRLASAVAGGAEAIEELVARNADGVARRGKIGRPLLRRELFVRGAGGAAATSAIWGWPAQAAELLRADAERCREDRDCGRFQECRGRTRRGRCRCTGAFVDQGDRRIRIPDECGKDCTNFDLDPKNCGGCVPGDGVKCERGPAGGACVQGECVGGDGSVCPDGCSVNEVCCGGRCVQPNFDRENCGGCGTNCMQAPGAGPRTTCCFGDCTTVGSDPDHCLRCDDKCPDDKPICFRRNCLSHCPSRFETCESGRGGRGTCYDPETEICCDGRVVAGTDSCECEYGPGAVDAFSVGAFCASGCHCGPEVGCCG